MESTGRSESNERGIGQGLVNLATPFANQQNELIYLNMYGEQLVILLDMDILDARSISRGLKKEERLEKEEEEKG